MLLRSVLHRTKAVNANYESLGQASVFSLDALRDIFEHQTQEYRDSVLPSHVKVRVAVEQASSFGWERYVGRAGCVLGMKTFGASAPLKELQRKFGFAPDQVVTVAKVLLSRSQRSHASVAA